MSDERRTPSELLQAAGGFLAALSTLAAAAAKYFGVVSSVLPASLQIPQPIQSVLSIIVVLAGLLLVWNGLRARSRLLRPEALLLMPGRPDHLEGRAEDVERLARACKQYRIIFLIGESGAGKTALLRAGLVPVIGSFFHPIYVDTWGDEWERGPRRSLREAFVRSLTSEQAKLLGVGQWEDETLFDTLRQFSVRVGLRPLLILDQFDDYQILHLDRFLNEQLWIAVEEVTTQNRYWAELRRLVEADEAHVVVATRSDAAAGLDSIRLVPQPARFNLHRLSGSVVEPLLIRLTETKADAQPIISHPESGWIQLRARLASELAKNGAVLAAQMRVACASLTNLNPLSIASFEAIGGLRGLEATYIRRHVTETARISGLTESQVRQLLLGLVDPTKTKTLPQSYGEVRKVLLGTAPTPDPESELDQSLQRALEDLLDKQIVRRFPATSRGDAVYVLRHDYLCNGVVEVERQANRWMEALKEHYQTYAGATGSIWGAWKALLVPTISLRLAFHRLRGDFQYGPYARYAVLSLTRFGPAALVVVAAAIIGIKGAKFERELQLHLAEEDVRETVNHMFDPFGLGAADDILSPREESALWDLATNDYPEKRGFLRKILETPANSQRFVRRSTFILPALWGLDHSLARKLCEEECWPEESFYNDDPDILQAQAVVGAALPVSNRALLKSVLANAPSMVRKLPDPSKLARVAQSVAALVRRSAPVDAQVEFDVLCTRIETDNFSNNELSALGVMLSALAEQLSDAQVQPAFRRTYDSMRTKTGLQRWPAFAKTLMVLAGRSNATVAQSGVAILLAPEVVEPRTSFPLADSMLANLFSDMVPAVSKLSGADAKTDLDRVLTVMNRRYLFSGAGELQRSYHTLLSALATRLDTATVDGIFRTCWNASTARDYGDPHQACVLALSRDLSSKAAKDYLNLLITRDRSPQFPYDDETERSLGRDLGERLESSAAAAVFVQFRATVDKQRYHRPADTEVLAALAARIDLSDYPRVLPRAFVRADGRTTSDESFRALLAELARLDKPSDRWSYLRTAYSVLLEKAASEITHDRADYYLELITASFRTNFITDSQLAYARAVTALAPKLGADSASKAFDILVRLLMRSSDRSDDSEALVSIGGGLETLGPRMDGAIAKSTFNSFYKELIDSDSNLGRWTLASAIPPEAKQLSQARQLRQAAYVRALAGVVRPGDEPMLLELLKRPQQGITAKQALIRALGRLLGALDVQDNVWKLVEAAERRNLKVTERPARYQNFP